MLREPGLAHAAQLALLAVPIPFPAGLARGAARRLQQQRDHLVDGQALVEQRGADGELGVEDPGIARPLVLHRRETLRNVDRRLEALLPRDREEGIVRALAVAGDRRLVPV